MPKITFTPDQLEIEVPSGTTILRAAQKTDAQVGYACGGNLACSTCHVYVRRGFDSLSDMEEDEDDILDKAFDVQPVSRLACQAEVGSDDIVCEITKESRKAWFDEHPQERAKAKAAK